MSLFSLFKISVFSALLIIVNPSFADQGSAKVINSETYKIGLMVEEINLALKAKNKEQSLQTITEYGTDSRYYSMIRGWLFQELVSVESQLGATKNASDSIRFQKQSNFLKQAIINIDLE